MINPNCLLYITNDTYKKIGPQKSTENNNTNYTLPHLNFFHPH